MPRDYPKHKAVLLKLPHEVVEEIQRRCEGPAKLFQPSGVAGWLRKIVYRELGIPLTETEPIQKGVEIPLHLIDKKLLTPVECLVVDLALSGRNMRQSALYLTGKQILPPEGSRQWSHTQIKRLLQDAVAKSLVGARSGL